MRQPEYLFEWYRDDCPGDHKMPAELLAAALDAAQRAFHYAGMIVEGSDDMATRLRVRVPQAIAQKYVLRCHPAQPGSYAIPAELGYPELIEAPHLAAAAELFNDAMHAIHSTDRAAYLASLPWGVVGRAFVTNLVRIVPPVGSGWSTRVRDSQGQRHVLDEDVRRKTESLIRQITNPPTTETGTVTGELRAINFAERSITILHPADDRELKCSYLPEDEITLIENRLSLVHVTGRLIRDASGRIKSIEEVDRIEPYDLSPIRMSGIDIGHGRLLARQPLELIVNDDPETDHQWLTVEYTPLSILVTAATRAQAVESLHAEIAMLWTEYVEDQGTDLSPSGQALKAALQHHFKMVRPTHAT